MYVDDILLSLTCSFIRSGSRILLIKSNGILFNGVFLTVLILGPMSHLSQLSIYCILIAEREGEANLTKHQCFGDDVFEIQNALLLQKRFVLIHF